MLQRCRHITIRVVVAALVIIPMAGGGDSTSAQSNSCRVTWHPQQSKITTSLRGLSVVDSGTAWASGAEGTVIRTIDGGAHWTTVSPRDSSSLDFRDIHAFDDQRAVVINAGSPGRIFATRDGGDRWRMCFEDPRPEIFFDAMEFWSSDHGMAFADPIDGTLPVIHTADGGRSWQPVAQSDQVAARPREAGFAASGTCLAVQSPRRAWIGLGGATDEGKARLLRSTDGGRRWGECVTPLPASESSGIFSVVFLDARQGIIVGGDYRDPQGESIAVAVSSDGGRSWDVPRGPALRGYRSCVAVCRPGQPLSKSDSGARHAPFVLVAVGPDGANVSSDLGQSWQHAGEVGYHTVAFPRHGNTGWAVGDDGRVAALTIEQD